MPQHGPLGPAAVPSPSGRGQRVAGRPRRGRWGKLGRELAGWVGGVEGCERTGRPAGWLLAPRPAGLLLERPAEQSAGGQAVGRVGARRCRHL